MGISEKKMKIVINNYFKQECDVNTSIREAFEKGFRIGVKKGLSAQLEPKWIPCNDPSDLPKNKRLWVKINDAFENAPTIELKHEAGEWKPYTYVAPDDWYQDKEIRYRCSKCGVEVINESNFCPNCGANMRTIERREE